MVSEGREYQSAKRYGSLDGELDAALVFAAAADEAYRTGKVEYGDACISDAKECYEAVIVGIPLTSLTSEQRRCLEVKLNHLCERLDRLRSMPNPATNEAA